jgi:hypothetical protein
MSHSVSILRLAVRLKRLPLTELAGLLSQDLLAEIIAQLCSKRGLSGNLEESSSRALLRSIDERLAVHDPLPQWAVDKVLLSSDLLMHLLAPLDICDGAAAAVCSAWSRAWTATNDSRRGLREVPLEALDFEWADAVIAVFPDGDRLLAWVHGEDQLRIVDSSMRTVERLPFVFPVGDLATDGHSIFVTHAHLARVDRMELRGASVTPSLVSLEVHGEIGDMGEEYEVDEGMGIHHFTCPTFVRGHHRHGKLCCMAWEDGYTATKVVIFCADSLAPLSTITRHEGYKFEDINAISAVGTLLHIAEKYSHAVYVIPCETTTRGDRGVQRVLGWEGQLLRTITGGDQEGDWGHPENVCCVHDRLYVTSMRPNDSSSQEMLGPLYGRRIFAMTLEGEHLQAYEPPSLEEGWEFCECSMLAFGEKLLVCVQSMGDGPQQRRMIAMKGV